MGISITSIIAWTRGWGLPGAEPLTGPDRDWISPVEVYERQTRIYPELSSTNGNDPLVRRSVSQPVPESTVASDTTTPPEMVTLPPPDAPITYTVTTTEYKTEYKL
jgi:hypothetical protein